MWTSEASDLSLAVLLFLPNLHLARLPKKKIYILQEMSLFNWMKLLWIFIATLESKRKKEKEKCTLYNLCNSLQHYHPVKSSCISFLTKLIPLCYFHFEIWEKQLFIWFTLYICQGNILTTTLIWAKINEKLIHHKKKKIDKKLIHHKKNDW